MLWMKNCERLQRFVSRKWIWHAALCYAISRDENTNGNISFHKVYDFNYLLLLCVFKCRTVFRIICWKLWFILYRKLCKGRSCWSKASISAGSRTFARFTVSFVICKASFWGILFTDCTSIPTRIISVVSSHHFKKVIPRDLNNLNNLYIKNSYVTLVKIWT